MIKRETGVGGTDISAIMGVNPYKNDYDVFLEKTGRSSGPEDNEPMYWGRMLEEVVAQRYQADNPDVKVCTVDVMRHPEHSWWIGSPDREVVKGGHRVRGLEIKTAGYYQKKNWGEPYTDQIPRHYLLQAMWYMPVLGVNEMHIPVLFGGQEYQEYIVKRDNELLEMMSVKAEKFWLNHVMKDEPPEGKPDAVIQDMLAAKYPTANDNYLEADESSSALATRYLEVVALRKSLEEERKGIMEKLKEVIGENKGVRSEDFRCMWYNRTTKKPDWKSVQGHFIRTLEKNGMRKEEAEKTVSDIIAANTNSYTGRQFSVTATKKKEEE